MPLFLDIYQSDATCTGNRPTAVFVHGGSFVTGNKENDTVDRLSEALNARGINLVSIQYRLFGDNPVLSAPYLQVRNDVAEASGRNAAFVARADAIGASFEDTVTALNFLQSNQSTYCLDMSNYALWGSSAGSFAIMQVGYGLNQYGIARPEPKVVMNYWGGLFNTNDMETGEAPFLTLHGTNDGTVDYQQAQDLATRAGQVGINFSFYSVINGGHGFGLADAKVDDRDMVEISADFVEAHLTGGTPKYETLNVTQ